MVKGIARQVIVVKSPDTRLFEQAIFLLKEDAMERNGVTEQALLDEARRAADGYLARKMRRNRRSFLPFAWASAGAALTGFVWFVSQL